MRENNVLRNVSTLLKAYPTWKSSYSWGLEYTRCQTHDRCQQMYIKKKFQFTVIKVLFIMTCVLDRQVGDSPKELQKLNRVNPTPNYPVFLLCVYPFWRTQIIMPIDQLTWTPATGTPLQLQNNPFFRCCLSI